MAIEDFVNNPETLDEAIMDMLKEAKEKKLPLSAIIGLPDKYLNGMTAKFTGKAAHDIDDVDLITPLFYGFMDTLAFVIEDPRLYQGALEELYKRWELDNPEKFFGGTNETK